MTRAPNIAQFFLHETANKITVNVYSEKNYDLEVCDLCWTWILVSFYFPANTLNIRFIRPKRRECKIPDYASYLLIVLFVVTFSCSLLRMLRIVMSSFNSASRLRARRTPHSLIASVSMRGSAGYKYRWFKKWIVNEFADHNCVMLWICERNIIIWAQ